MQVGHILGLGHPDHVEHDDASNVHSRLLASNNGMQPMNESTCQYPWDAVVDGVWTDAADKKGDTGVRASIMGALERHSNCCALCPLHRMGPTAFPFCARTEALTQHNPSVCLSSDDLEGLNVLYPQCGGAAITQTGCFKSRHNIGWVRLAALMGVPGLITFFLLMLLNSWVRSYQAARIESAKNLALSVNRQRAHERLKRKELEAADSQRTAEAIAQVEEAQRTAQEAHIAYQEAQAKARELEEELRQMRGDAPDEGDDAVRAPAARGHRSQVPPGRVRSGRAPG